MDCENFDLMNPEISSIEYQQANQKPKKKVLQKNTIYRKQTHKEKGIVYNSYLRGLNQIFDQKRDKKQERSRKINCFGHASIIKDPKCLDLSYHPKRKVNKQTQELQGVPKVQKYTIKLSRLVTKRMSYADQRDRQLLLESWDVKQQRQQKIDFIWTLILLIILLLLVSKSFRQHFFGSYSKIRRLYDD